MKMKHSALVLALVLMAVPALADLADYLPPNDTPLGWSRDGGPANYNSGNIGNYVSNAAPFTGNGLQSAVVQYYKKGGKEVIAEIYDMGSRDNAEAAFNALAQGKNVDIDLGNGSVIENEQMFFYVASYVVRVKTDMPDEETAQTMATLSQTIWFSLE